MRIFWYLFKILFAFIKKLENWEQKILKLKEKLKTKGKYSTSWSFDPHPQSKLALKQKAWAMGVLSEWSQWAGPKLLHFAGCILNSFQSWFFTIKRTYSPCISQLFLSLPGGHYHPALGSVVCPSLGLMPREESQYWSHIDDCQLRIFSRRLRWIVRWRCPFEHLVTAQENAVEVDVEAQLPTLPLTHHPCIVHQQAHLRNNRKKWEQKWCEKDWSHFFVTPSKYGK